MPSIIRNSDTENCLRKLLKNEGYSLSAPRSYGQTGVDILAEKEGEALHIEVIGYKISPPARSKDFYEGFFRAISRLKDGAEKCVLALPEQFSRGLPQRARHYAEAWLRIGGVFPELEIWLIDTEHKTYKRTSWNQWLYSRSGNRNIGSSSQKVV